MTQRTNQQRKAVEVYCRELAKALNEAGLDQREVFSRMKEGAEIPWSQDTVKENIWKQIQSAMLMKDSTTDLETVEVSQVYEVVNRFTASRLGVSVRFPDRHGEAA